MVLKMRGSAFVARLPEDDEMAETLPRGSGHHHLGAAAPGGMVA
jgi:hypothetical protein